MEIHQLTDLVQENINMLSSIENYKKILNRANNLGRFNVLNRLLINIQSNKAVDIRTDEEWNIKCRKVNIKAKPIYLIMPRYKYAYIDTSNGKEIKSNELTVDEINQALKYNIITKNEVIEDIFTLPFYDVRQTYSVDNSRYTVVKPVVNSKILLEITQDILGADIKLCDEDYYSKSDNTLYIAKKPYKELAYALCIYISNFLVDNKLDNIVEKASYLDTSDISEYDYDLIKTSLAYSIYTVFAGNNIDGSFVFDFDLINHTSNNKLFSILNIVDALIVDVISRLKYNSKLDSSDATHSINIMRKAEAILDIFEANNINKMMKGN